MDYYFGDIPRIPWAKEADYQLSQEVVQHEIDVAENLQAGPVECAGIRTKARLLTGREVWI